jgi:hypothetical protein
VHHVQTDTGNVDHSLGDIEDQMTMFTGAAGEKSPDRLDSLVWAITPFLNYPFGNAKSNGTVRHFDVAGETEKRFPSKAPRNRRELPRDNPYAPVELDSLDDWAPPEVQRRGRVRGWANRPSDFGV